MKRNHEEGPPDLDEEIIRGWITGRLPDEWFTAAPLVVIDREEITVIGQLPVPDLAADLSEAERSATVSGKVAAFRASTRDERIAIAADLEH